jgi:hypothetical protein
MVSLLRGDTTLAAKLGSFRGHPSIFGTAPIPETATTPFIVTQSVSDVTLNTKSGTVREIGQDIGIYDEQDGSPADVELIAEYVREKLRSVFDVPDWTMAALDISGPVLMDSERVHGRVLSARIIIGR